MHSFLTIRALVGAACVAAFLTTSMVAHGTDGPDPIAIAQEHLEAGRTEAAITTMRMAIEHQPNNASFYAKLGYFYRYAGLTERSIAAYRKSEALNPSPKNLIADDGQIAKALIHAGDYAGAAADRVKLFDLSRQNGLEINEKMYFYQGVEALFAGHSVEAIRAFDASEGVGADTIWTRFALAYRDLARGDTAAVLADAKRLQGLADTHDGERHYRVAHLYAGAGDKAEALKAIGAAINAGFFNASALEHDPPFSTLRSDPKFQQLQMRAKERQAAADREAAAPLPELHFVLAIHGGGGVPPRAQMTPEMDAAIRTDLARSLKAGQAMLAAGGTSIDAVEAAIKVMEDSPLFNAGKGASFNRDGVQTFDASIMDGRTHMAGSVGSVELVKNPISLARLVMEHSPHVMLVGEGALAFAREHNLDIEPPHYFFTQDKWDSLEERLRLGTAYGKKNEDGEAPGPEASAGEIDWRAFGTVGAVALDAWGNLAAGTSTGGREGKLPGRVGDSAIIGAGNYADNATLAVSSTGLGEYVMRLVNNKNMADRMAYSGWSLDRATRDGVDAVTALGGTIGVVALDRQGHVAMPYGGNGMKRGVVRDQGEPVVQLYDK